MKQAFLSLFLFSCCFLFAQSDTPSIPYVGGWLMKVSENGTKKFYDANGTLAFDGVQAISDNQLDPLSRFRIIQKDGKFGLLSPQWRLTVPAQYNSISNLANTKFFVFQENKLYGIFDTLGKIVISPQYDQIDVLDLESVNKNLPKLRCHKGTVSSIFDMNQMKEIVNGITSFDFFTSNSMGIVLANSDNKKGVLSKKTGNMIVPFFYDTIEAMRMGCFIAKKRGVCDLLDSMGKKLLVNQDINKTYFGEENYFTFYNNHEKGYFDYEHGITRLTGFHSIYRQAFANKLDLYHGEQLMVDFEDKNTHTFPKKMLNKQDIAPIEPSGIWSVKSEKLEYYLSEAKEVVQVRKKYPDFDIVTKFEKDFARAIKNKKWGVIDTLGRELIPFEYDHIQEIWVDKAVVLLDGNLGLLSFNKKKILPLQYSSIELNADGQLRVVSNTGKYGLFSTTGTEILPCKYDYIYCDDPAFLAVSKDGLWAIFDKKGQQKSPFLFQSLHKTMGGGLLGAKSDNYYGYINLNGQWVIPNKYDEATVFKDGYASVRKGNLWAVIDQSGNLVTGFEYEKLEPFYRGKALAQKGKYGYIDTTGQIVIPFQFEDAMSFTFESGCAYYKNNNEDFGLMDETGKSLTGKRFFNRLVAV